MNFQYHAKKRCTECQGITEIKRVKEFNWKAAFIFLCVFSAMLVTGIVTKIK